MICDRSPTGTLKGKSKLASIMASKIHHPAMEVTNAKAPPAYIFHIRLLAHLSQATRAEEEGERREE